MPKIKTRKIASKRIKITATGKLMKRGQGSRHLRRRKSKRAQRAQAQDHEVKNTRFANKLYRMIHT